METPTNVEELFALYEARGGEGYGEDVTQLEHGLQCAALARSSGASDELVIAALFHDVGHLVVEKQNQPGFNLDEEDDDHEAIGARVLSSIFGPGVAQPVALHVTAKRWRCAVDPSYTEALSEASRATLRAQGGPLDEAASRRFEAHPGFHDALTLRSWDDQGKVVGLEVTDLASYRDVASSLSARWSQGRPGR